jgi:hypothetical protein
MHMMVIIEDDYWLDTRMGPPQLSNAVRWQIIGMREAGILLRQIAQRVGHHHSTVSRIVNKHWLKDDYWLGTGTFKLKFKWPLRCKIYTGIVYLIKIIQFQIQCCYIFFHVYI